MLKWIVKILLNRYFVAIVAFGVWIFFFDNYSLVRQYKLEQQLKGLQEMEQHYKSQIAQNRSALKELETNKQTLEKFARENYLMKRDNEDIYLVIKK